MNDTKQKDIYTPLIVTGYITFALLVLSTLISTTIPFGALLLQSSAKQDNVLVSMMALTVGAILPILIGYIIGSRVAAPKNIAARQFNGVLFGIVGLWIMALLGPFIWLPFAGLDQNVMMIAAGLIPGIVAAVIAITLTLLKTKHKSTESSMLSYVPFIATLTLLILAVLLSSIIQGIIASSLGLHSLTPLVLMLLSGATAYLMLARAPLTVRERLAWSTIAISAAYAIATVTYFFVTSTVIHLVPANLMATLSIDTIVPAILSLIAWAAYWLYQTRSLRSSPEPVAQEPGA